MAITCLDNELQLINISQDSNLSQTPCICCWHPFLFNIHSKTVKPKGSSWLEATMGINSLSLWLLLSTLLFYLFICLAVLVLSCSMQQTLLSLCGLQTQLLYGMWDLSFLTRNQTPVPCTGRQAFNHWTTGEVPRALLLDAFLLQGEGEAQPCDSGRVDWGKTVPYLWFNLVIKLVIGNLVIVLVARFQQLIRSESWLPREWTVEKSFIYRVSSFVFCGIRWELEMLCFSFSCLSKSVFYVYPLGFLLALDPDPRLIRAHTVLKICWG